MTPTDEEINAIANSVIGNGDNYIFAEIEAGVARKAFACLIDNATDPHIQDDDDIGADAKSHHDAGLREGELRGLRRAADVVDSHAMKYYGERCEAVLEAVDAIKDILAEIAKGEKQ